MAARKTTTKAKTEEKAEETTPEVTAISAKELASQLETDPKSLRRWLRSITTNRAGKGGRWVFDSETVTQLTELWETRKAKGTEPEVADAEA